MGPRERTQLTLCKCLSNGDPQIITLGIFVCEHEEGENSSHATRPYGNFRAQLQALHA